LLDRVRAAAKADRERKGGRWLALIPIGIGALFLGLLMPRAAPPDGVVPLPRVDARELTRIATSEDAAARLAEEKRLPTDVLAVGSALRAFKTAEAKNADPATMAKAKQQLDGSLNELGTRPNLEEDMLSLRAVQTRHFLDALQTWEKTGEKTSDLEGLGGSFLDRLVEAGWATTEPRRLLLGDAQRRVAFKMVWNALLGVERRPAFAVPLGEERAMYALYLEHPHPGDSQRGALAAQRKAATTPEACSRAQREEARQAQIWRAEKIKKLSSIDPDYPASFAIGIVYYEIGRYDLAADAFTAWLNAHPSGPYTLRARNHLKAAVLAGGA
jgi:TolA-binding protein